jgi:exodeoxyribonuclease VII large subunit
VPVMSAVGHEIDFTISDFVADIRAATPSAGAELITEGAHRRCQWLARAHGQIIAAARERVEAEREALVRVTTRLRRAHPRRRLNERLQELDDLRESVVRCTRRGLQRQGDSLFHLQERLLRVRPSRHMTLRRELMLDLTRRFQEQAHHALALRQQRLLVAQERLRLLSPMNVLERGFSVTRDAATGRVLRHAAEGKPGQQILTQFHDGQLQSVVEPTEELS